MPSIKTDELSHCLVSSYFYPSPYSALHVVCQENGSPDNFKLSGEPSETAEKRPPHASDAYFVLPVKTFDQPP